MTTGNWIALGLLIASIVIPLTAALVSHIRHDERRESRLEQIESELGTRDTGIRGAVHEHANKLTWLSGCIWTLAQKLGIDLPKRDK